MNDAFARHIETWYEREGRVLPWRQTRDPYRIWVSEVILQQTQVAQGYDYFLRFVEAFPTVEALAQSSEDAVLRAWQGLGYYSRARNLHKAAQMVAAMPAFPKDYATIHSLPGVGDYTAAAICSLAFDMPRAVVDGNVYRVIARFLGIDTPIDTGGGKRIFAQLAEEMLDKQHPALYNQAIMDFGALQCVPHNPECAHCPLADGCAALAEGRVEDLPVKQRKPKVTNRFMTYVRIVSGDKVWLHRREKGDIWEGLYEYYLMESESPMEERDVLAALPQGELRLLEKGLRHRLTHRLLQVDLYELHLSDASPDLGANGLWVPQGCLDNYAMPRLLLL